MPMAAAAACKVPRLSIRCSDSRSADVSTDEQSDAPKPRLRRTRLFKALEGIEPHPSAAPAAAPAQQPAEAGRAAAPVSEEFRRAFEDLGLKPAGLNKLSRGTPRVRRDAAGAGDASSSSGRNERQQQQRYGDGEEQLQRQQQQRRQRQDADSERDERGGSWRDRPPRTYRSRDEQPWQQQQRPRYDDEGGEYGGPWRDRPPRSHSSDHRSSARSSGVERGASGRQSRDRDEQPWQQQQQQQQREQYRDDDREYGGSWRDRPPRSYSSDRSSGGGSRERARVAGEGAAAARRPWLNRGKVDRSTAAAADDVAPPRGGSDAQRRRWEWEAEERARLQADEERRRLIRKARSETIPKAPSPKQDKVIFQAITREWDDKASQEELRGARASARKIARVGIYDRNKGIRAVRRKAMQNPAAQTDEEAAQLAASAARQIQAAAAKSIQPSKESIYQGAAGVKRSFERAEALPEGEWERLKMEYRAIPHPIKIGRKGANPALIGQIQQAWRGREVVKLVIHDDKSARKVNLPRLNLLLRELEEKSGGVLVDAAGASIWLYRGVDWVPPPVPPPYKPPPQHELFTQEHTPLGSWRGMAGISCYVVGSSKAAGLTSPDSSSSSSSRSSSSSSSDSSKASSSVTGSSSSGDAMTVLLLPDQFSFQDTSLLMQMADRVASKGALVIMPDLLGPSPSAPNSNVTSNGTTPATKTSGYWIVRQWPLVKKRKLEYMDWFSAGPGSWLQQRPRLLQLLEEMQQQGLYDKTAAAAAAAAAGSSSADSSSSDSSSTAGRPLGVLGLGWGTYIGLRAAGDDACIAAGLVAVAAMSPVTFQKDYELASALQLPVALLPAKYDPMEQVMLTVDLLQRPYAKRCIFKRYGMVKPGWANWLPQWIDNRAMYQAAEQLLMSVAFLKRELLGQDSALLPPPITAADTTAAGNAAAAEAEAAQEAYDDDDDSWDGQESSAAAAAGEERGSFGDEDSGDE